MGGGGLETKAGRGAGDQDILIFWGSINLTIICDRLFLLLLHMHAVVGDSVDKQRLHTFPSLCRFLEVFFSLEVRMAWWFSGACKASSL